MSPTKNSGFLRGLARALVRFYYPRIEVTGGALIRRHGPVLLVANHPNSLIDAVLLGIAAERPVQLLAKAPLFEVPVFGAMLRALGMVPAYRGTDDAKQVSRNVESLARAAGQLARGGVMGIFPEGKSHDANQVALVRSGAARLALQAVALMEAHEYERALSPGGVQVVPVGINYERKERFRTAVWIKIGRPIDATAWRRMHADEHTAMRTLTAEIAARLKRCVTHLDNAAWDPLLAELEALLPAARGGRRAALATLHRRKRAAEAINHFHQKDPGRAAAAAQRVAAHAAALRTAGITAEARGFSRRGLGWWASMLQDAAWLVLGGAFGLIGFLHHAVPYGIVRAIAGRTAGAGRMVVALHRLGFSLPVYAGWYAFVWWRMSLYFVPWVAWAWVALMPFAGLAALASARRLRLAASLWLAEARLIFAPSRAAELRREHAAVAALLDEFEVGGKAERRRDGRMEKSVVVYRPPWWVSLTATAMVTAGAMAVGAWLFRDRPIEVFRQSAPALHELAQGELAERIESDERALVVVIGELERLEARFRAFETALALWERSYYRPEDDDEIRRMLVSYLAFRTALLRTAWFYQRHSELEGAPMRLRALLVHYAAAAVAYDYAARFVLAFDGAAVAQRKLNEPEPRWDLPAGTYGAIRANLAHVSHRRWLEDGWRNYHATLPAWEAEPAFTKPGIAERHAVLHRAIVRAGENTARLSEKLLAYKIRTAAADVVKFTRGSWYRASAAVSTLVGDARIREPRGHGGMITEVQMAALGAKLQPGDIVIERRNWYLSNAFLPGYWPHAALYVGAMEDLRALGLDVDSRVARHLARFARPDASGHRPSFIEAISEGVVFTSLEHSVGGADSVAVLRPRLTPAQRREVIARAFSYAGKPYDFDFDFFSADKLVCTELVYRALSSHVDFPLVEILGRKTLPALEIVRFWASRAGAPQLEFVAFLDGEEKTGTCTERDAEALEESISRPALTWLQ